ncbi:MAG: hypothetical protein AAF721_12540 [Myxococcota bacterium]
MSVFAVVAAYGCDPHEPAADGDDAGERGHIGKADLAGSCVDACGEKSNGNCWCDDACADFGDCCADKADVCDASEITCEGPNPAGCVETGCDADEVCATDTEQCVSSACECDASTGQWQCTPDCGGGVCVPDDGGDQACEGENPAGCAENGCGDGEECVTDVGGCVPSACSCDGSTGTWLCTADCSGGVCVPAANEACEDENPAGCVSTGCGAGQTCTTETDACTPSVCSCNEAAGTWDCTPDCGGGECVDDTGCPGSNPAEICPDDPDACIPSACACDEAAMVWNCTPDCSGGTDCS